MKSKFGKMVPVLALALVGTAALSLAACSGSKYTVTWEVNGQTVTEEYREGEMPYYKGETAKDGSGSVTYTFSGWNAELSAVKEDVTYVAKYSETEQAVDKTIAIGTYTGTLVDGKPSGTGKLVTDDWTYEGTFEDGLRLTGTGVKSYNNGETSKGNFVNGNLNGWGMHDFNNGCIGMGEWSNGQMNGTMWFTWTHAGGGYEVYIGDWVNGSRNDDSAFYTFNNGCWYIGEFDDWINGKGEFHWTNGNYFEGNFAGGSPVKGSYGYGQMDGVKGYIKVDETTGAWSWYNGTTEDGKTVVNGQVVE